jgi:hypothetical protein
MILYALEITMVAFKLAAVKTQQFLGV